MSEKNLRKIALNSEYLKSGYGYKKITNDKTHWITFFSNDQFQMYGYYTDDSSMEKIYDTGIIHTTETEIQILIDIFTVSNS